MLPVNIPALHSTISFGFNVFIIFLYRFTEVMSISNQHVMINTKPITSINEGPWYSLTDINRYPVSGNSRNIIPAVMTMMYIQNIFCIVHNDLTSGPDQL